MTLELPRLVPLDPPDEDPTALEELATAITGGAFHLGLLGAHLTGPAASVRDWIGQDATAAVAQVGALAGLVRAERDAVSTAAARVEAHAGLVRDTVAGVRGLQAVQRDEFGAAVHRLTVLVGRPLDPFPGPPPEAVAVVEEFRAAESRRAAAHAALLAELADDAAATARVLVDSTAVVGGTGAPGDDGRVLRTMALALPGWGDQELAGRGRALAAALTGRVSPGRVDDLARGAAEWVGVPAYADALLAALGYDGVRWLLSMVGEDTRAGDSPVAGLLAGAFGSALPGGPGAEAGEVLSGRYVTAEDPDGAADVVALGMFAVLAAGLRPPGGGPGARTLVSWGAQVLARERAQQASAQERVPRAQAAGQDVVGLVVRLLARTGDATAAAQLLTAPEAFATLLARTWPGGVTDLVQLVRLAGSSAGVEGGAVARAGLAALGEGLAPGSSGTWTVQRATAAALTPEIAGALTRHVDVLTGLLSLAGGTAPWAPDDDAALRGLGCLTWDSGAAGRLSALLDARVRSAAPTGGRVPAAAQLGAFVAIQQYGQRLDHALAAAAAQSGAIDRQILWSFIEQPLGQLDGPAGQVLGLGLPFVSHALGADGTWDAGPDRGAVFTRLDAAARALIALGGRASLAVADDAASAFDATLGRLGVPTGPVPPSWSWQQTLLDALPSPIEKVIEGELPEPADGHRRPSSAVDRLPGSHHR